MQANWKLGFTRLFAVLWAIWLLLVLFIVLPIGHLIGIVNVLEAVLVSGIAVPGALFFALRWVLSGFDASKSS